MSWKRHARQSERPPDVELLLQLYDAIERTLSLGHCSPQLWTIGKSVNEFGKGSRSIKDTEKDSPICPYSWYYHGNYIQRALRSFTGKDNAAAIDDVWSRGITLTCTFLTELTILCFTFRLLNYIFILIGYCFGY